MMKEYFLIINIYFMRKTILLVTVLFLSATVIYLNSCKKADSTAFPDTGIVSKVKSWLDNQKSKDKPTVSAKIQMLEDNLNFSALRSEQFSGNEYFIIIPVNKNYKSGNNAGKDPVNNLLLFISKSGVIRRGNIVQFIPDDRQKNPAVPANTFFNYFNSQSLGCNGKFSFLNIVDQLQYEFKYENGKFSSFGVVKSRQSSRGQNNRENEMQCFDRYLITTSYYDDGTIEVQEEYLYTFCVCVFGSPCDQLDGGGGDSANNCCIPDSDVHWSSSAAADGGVLHCGRETISTTTGLPTKLCAVDWTYNPNNLAFWSWKYKSTEQSNVEKIGTEWKFIIGGTTHVSTALDGSIPPCIEFNHTINATTPFIRTDRKEASMRLDYTNSLKITCWILSPTSTETLSSETHWFAP